jgi:parallel beta-helix repeat protein
MTFGTQGKGYWQRNTIRNNKSDENGGGIHASVGAEIVFERNDVTGNVCGNDRGGIGGGVYIRNATFWSLGGNLFENNRCLNGGGGGLALHAKDNSGNTQLTRLARLHALACQRCDQG